MKFNNRILLAAIFVHILLLASTTNSAAASADPTSFRYDFYEEICANAEKIVWNATKNIVTEHENSPAQLLRLLFHDCFIQGCDASVMLDDRNGKVNRSIERLAIPNKTLKGFDYIDSIKELVEEECPGVVSCADILVLAARDAIALSGGPFYPIMTGRRDSTQSYVKEAIAQIPKPDGKITETLRLFAQRGFDERETVALLGGHSIGRISCEFIKPRLQNPNAGMPEDFLSEMRMKCRDTNNSISSEDQSSGGGFDTHYYEGLRKGRGLLAVDMELMANEKTSEAVRDYSENLDRFRIEFAKAMLKLSNLNVLVGLQGEVRRNCSRLSTS